MTFERKLLTDKPVYLRVLGRTGTQNRTKDGNIIDEDAYRLQSFLVEVYNVLQQCLDVFLVIVIRQPFV
jgi:hypothetical protein